MSPNPKDIAPDVLAMLPAELQAQAPFYDETTQPKIKATLAVCTIIAYVALGLRLYARHITKQAFGLDDLFACLAVVFTTVSIALVAYITHLGVGRHEIVIVLEHIEYFDALNKTLIVGSVIYLPVIFSIKASALFLYCRIFPNRRLRAVCYAILVVSALYSIASILVVTIACLPSIPPTTEQPVAQLKCAGEQLIDILLAILITNVVLDAIILCLPLPLIWRLQTTLRRKLQLTLVFTLGSFIFIVSILRVVAVRKLDLFDDNWYATDVELWSIAESAVGILTVSLPVMQPLLRRCIYRKDRSTRITATPKNSNPGQNQNRSGGGPISLLTFGRSGIKGPSGRKRHGLDMTTMATLTTVDTNLDDSMAKLVPEDRNSHDGEHVKPVGCRENAIAQPSSWA
ncbi:hypothetical protein O1611_g561 [Lasiodiplodia mahajangana]|uniref:Uncharacterized protein n=1 Tax=Lasiodiplodia mahajangana TaxID=1108764 RepID=A0ACC2JZU1_9PEZI|nr:hypothetical protein O1611_g561 [Lasiodiplodia mahajangana]